MTTQTKHRVVIIGGGFGGLKAAKQFARHPHVEVTLIDRRNFHLFQPLLYQVATGALSPANIAAPLRALFKGQRNVRVVMAEVQAIDAAARQVQTDAGSIAYDSLIVAAGMRHLYYGHSDWEAHAPGLKTIEDATEIRRRVLSAFERAETAHDPEERRALLTFCVLGAGPTGVELAGAIAEIAHYTLKHDFRSYDPASATILLVEGADRILAAYPEALSAYAQTALTQLGVTLRLNTKAEAISADGVTLMSAAGHEHIRAETVLWAAGVQASPLAQALNQATQAPLDRLGRVMVNPDLSVPNQPEIYVIGDMAHFAHTPDGKPLPGVAQVAMQQGRYAARHILARLQGQSLPPFRYADLGNMATIGRAAAVADLHRLRFTGFIGWLAWLFVHLMSLVSFHNRLLVLFQWAWNYITRNRSARLITGEKMP